MKPANFILLAAALAFAVGAAEVAVRLVPAAEPLRYRNSDGDSLFEPDTLLGFRSARNAHYRVWSNEYDLEVETNSLGLRGPDPAETLAANGCRVVLIGDSFVHGLTVPWDHTFGQVAARTLQSRAGKECAFVAGGVEGYSTAQELLFFRRDLLAYRPTLTVLFVYWNDIICNAVPQACGAPQARVFRIENDSLVLGPGSASSVETTRTAPPQVREVSNPPATAGEGAGSPLPTRNFRGWLADHSRLYALLRQQARMALGLDRRPPRRGLRSEMFLEPLPARFSVFKQNYDSAAANAWRVTELLILQLRKEANAARSQFAVLYVPMRESIHRDQWELAGELHSLASYDPARVGRHLANFCEENALRCLDPSPQFRQHLERGGGGLYLLNDPHWNAAGHAFVGLLLADFVASIVN